MRSLFILFLMSLVSGCNSEKACVCAVAPTPSWTPKMKYRQCYSDGTTLSERNPRVVVAGAMVTNYVYFYYIPTGLIPLEHTATYRILESWYPVEVECPEWLKK
jgi:hypothetical protein